MPPYYPREVDHPNRWRRCPECGCKAAGVRKDRLTTITHCDKCWFATDPAEHGHPGGKSG